MTRYGVYVYRDHEDRALYVGQTEDLARRDREHWQFGSWRPEACVVDVLSLHESRTEALAAEKRAIRGLRPLCNVAHSPGSNRDSARIVDDFVRDFFGPGGAA